MIIIIDFIGITCAKPVPILNGKYIGSDFTYGGVIRYVCDAKYSLTNGDGVCVCRTRNAYYSKTGYWDGIVPYCACKYASVSHYYQQNTVWQMQYHYISKGLANQSVSQFQFVFHHILTP